MKLIREVTDWSESPYPVKNHDYIVSNAYEFCFGMRKQGSDKWEQFCSRRRFNKSFRKFVVLDEKKPKEFVDPYMVNPWKNKTYNSLETFFE
jgi:hypothetical protein